MADYFPVLSDAVAKLETNTGEARRAVYERARAAIVRQLRAIDPPLSEDVISRERMQLEEAIRKVEAKAGGAAAPAVAPAPPAARALAADAARPAAPAPPAPRPPADAALPPAARRAGPPPQPSSARPAKRPDGRPIVRTAGEGGQSASKERSGAVVGLVALAAILIGVSAYAARGPIAGLIKGSEKTATTNAVESDRAATSNDIAAKTQEPVGKSDDRLTQDGQPAPAQAEPAPEMQASRQPAETVAPQQPAAEPAPQSPPAAATADSPPPAEAGPLVAQRATLYEEGPNKQAGEAVAGTVVWRTESVNAGQNQPLETAIRGDIDIPGRKLKGRMTIRRNTDATLPASHTIELQFTVPDDFPNAGITNVPGILMKSNEAARGAAISGLSVRVTANFFLIGLSNLETEKSVNEQLLRDRSWIDIPILYDNGRRALMTIEKGTPGAQAFRDAFAAWSSTPPTANAATTR